MNLKNFENQQLFYKKSEDFVVNYMKKSLEDNGICRIALSGGGTPQPLYRALSERSDITWEKIEIYQVDERFVHEDNEYSNKKMLNEQLLNNLKEKPKKTVFFETNKTSLDSLLGYESHLNNQVEPFFDLTLLGMGADGHTASLFPNDDLLKENAKWVGESHNGNPVSHRLSLTYPALKNSKKILFLIKGKDKKEMLEAALHANVPDSNIPAATLLQLSETDIYYCEE